MGTEIILISGVLAIPLALMAIASGVSWFAHMHERIVEEPEEVFDEVHQRILNIMESADKPVAQEE